MNAEPCPICDEEFYFNDICIASCGHTYHPWCLCMLVISSKKCKYINCEEVLNTKWCFSWGFGALGTEVFSSMKKMEGMANLCIFQQTPLGQMISIGVFLKFKLILANVE